MAEKIYHYPLWIRLWHLANALLCLTLIITGLSMQYSESGRLLVPFHKAVTLHNISAILLSINYLFFLVANRVSGNRKHYRITEKNYTNMLIKQFRYYTLGIFKREQAPFPITRERKFNPLQQFAYLIIMFGLIPLVMITGWGLLFPELIVFRVFGISGLFLTDLIHILAGFLISVFMVVHIYFCTFGIKLSSLFRGILNGWVEVH